MIKVVYRNLLNGCLEKLCFCGSIWCSIGEVINYWNNLDITETKQKKLVAIYDDEEVVIE